MPETQAVSSMVLNSWKEIASYVGRGVRTVQRWEADLGMPVRRPRAKSRSAVIALSDEIERWLRSAPTTELPSENHFRTNAAVLSLRQSVSTHVDLRERCSRLRATHLHELARLMANVAKMKDAVAIGKALRTAPPRHPTSIGAK